MLVLTMYLYLCIIIKRVYKDRVPFIHRKLFRSTYIFKQIILIVLRKYVSGAERIFCMGQKGRQIAMMNSHLRSSTSGSERSIRVSDIQWETGPHAAIIAGVRVKLTATEFNLLFPLRHGTPVLYEDLATLAYNYSMDDQVRVMMDKHIDRIRGKLRGTGIYIYCVLNYGYLLLPEVVSSKLRPRPRTTSSKRN
jgi:hypothetical protein